MKYTAVFIMLLCLSGCENSNSETVENTENQTEEIVQETTSETPEQNPAPETTEVAPESVNDDFVVQEKEHFLELIVDEKGAPRTWEAKSQPQTDYMFFRADGSIAGGDDRGEESMWEGTWTFEAGKLNIQSDSKVAGNHQIKYFPDDGALEINTIEYTIAQF